jgi:hypothetical protein
LTSKDFAAHATSVKELYNGKVTKCPLQKMPLIDEAFKRMAVDILGPIYPVTDRENRYTDRENGEDITGQSNEDAVISTAELDCSSVEQEMKSLAQERMKE